MASDMMPRFPHSARALRARAFAILCLAAMFQACAGDPGPPAWWDASYSGADNYRSCPEVDPQPPDVGRRCLEHERCVDYLLAVQKRVDRVWKPVGVSPVSVQVRLALGAAGEVQTMCVTKSSSEQAAREVQVAIESVAPFAPLPVDLGYMVGARILMTFQVEFLDRGPSERDR